MDPLAGSALSILEDGGGLPLVLDRLDEDDALCAALACTTLRDVLFAQPRHAVRAAGKPYAGKRIVTSVAGVASSAGRLAWVRGLSGAAPSWVRAWNSLTSHHLASVGGLEALCTYANLFRGLISSLLSSRCWTAAVSVASTQPTTSPSAPTRSSHSKAG